jgi:Fe-S cluster assembly protein SufD
VNALASYIEGFATQQKSQPWLWELKDASLQRAVKQGFPANRSEGWKYSSLTALEKRGFKPSISNTRLDATTLSSLLIPNLDSARAVFVNGRFDASLSQLPKGTHIVTAASADENLRSLLTLPAHWQDDTFANLNTALFQDALILELAADAVLEEPLEYLHVNVPGMEPAAYHLRCIVRLGSHAQATLVERYIGLETAQHLTNSLVQIDLAPGAKLAHVRLQEESPQGFHVGRVLVQQAADSSYISHNTQTGAAWSRLDIAADLNAPGANVHLNGLYTVNGRQHLDNHTWINHNAPYTASRELYRGILDGNGRAVFNGKVLVAKHAAKTDAQQSNHNLLLSKGAEIDTKPELEIYVDDVKCSHGATIGQLDEQQLFYLRSRGLDAETARAVLVGAFAGRLVDLLPLPALVPHVRERLSASIRQLKLSERS